jgi:hypothetical protein
MPGQSKAHSLRLVHSLPEPERDLLVSYLMGSDRQDKLVELHIAAMGK